ncbi:MAG TPA: hypothetical protein VF679_07110, partial [Pedobacter sp.]
MEQEHTRAVARYLEGDMEMQEMIAFESQLKQSVGLRQAMEAYKSSKSSLKIEKEPVLSITPTKAETAS